MNPQPKPKKEKRKRHRMTIECDISPEVRREVGERDNNCSILSGKRDRLEMAHYIPRSRGGRGIPENLVLLTKQEHTEYDNGDKRAEYEMRIEQYLRSKYQDWDRVNLIYDKWKDIDPAYRFDNSV
jgi:5-methylcytosine-specific restriction endonuclease McrA